MGISGGLAHFIPSNIMVSGFTHTCRSDEGSDATLTHLSPAITPDQSSSEISRVVPVSPEPRNIWPFKSLMVSKRLSQILNIKKPAEGRPVGISLVPLGTSIAETQTPPERTRDSKGTVRKDRRHNKERSRRKDRSKSRDRDRYEEIMEVEYK
ncbi:hypothetical protein GE061_015179 [Apolygus lucorum]|uniref:Uncharacterized protein n=1 Tax=Apolygus lucorum TaxID=248454 RepID=A0A8S9XK98_APOLU|nr:hypothetical protein GE061_015179 [Apolygus lucorum]